MEDEVSSYGPLSCCSDVFVSGKARKYFNDFMLPFAWNELVQGGSDRCYDDERCFERELCADREVELFQLKRNYNLNS